MALLPNVNIGDPIEPDHINDIRDSGVQVTTSGSRPVGPHEGMVIYETDTDKLMIYTGAAWIEFGQSGWTDVLAANIGFTQSGSVSKTVTYAAWRRAGRMIRWQGLVACTGAGTAGNAVTVSVPVGGNIRTAAATQSRPIGTFIIYDASVGGGTSYCGLAIPATASTIQAIDTSIGVTNVMGIAGGFTVALASGDQVSWNVEYEAAA